MYFVAKKSARVVRDGVQVYLPVGAPIPEASEFPNLSDLIRSGRIICDFKDGETPEDFQKNRGEDRLLLNPLKQVEVLKGMGIRLEGWKGKGNDIFDIYAVEVQGLDRELPEWYVNQDASPEELKAIQDAKEKKAKAEKAEAEAPTPEESDEVKEMRADLAELGFDVPADASEEKIRLVLSAAAGEPVDGRTIPAWAKAPLAALAG